MGKVIKETIHANGIDIGIYTQDFENEFISLTDIARYKSDDPTAVIQNWMRNRDVIEFLGLWERLHNPDFNPLEFEGFRKSIVLFKSHWFVSRNPDIKWHFPMILCKSVYHGIGFLKGPFADMYKSISL